MERLFLNLLRAQVQRTEHSLQFAFWEEVGVEDAVPYLLHRAHLHLDKESGTVRVLFLDFSSAFNTIQPPVLQGKLLRFASGPQPDCLHLQLPHRQAAVRQDITDTVVSSIGAPQGTVLSPILFTLHTTDFCYNS